jgi:hypothetical protein
VEGGEQAADELDDPQARGRHPEALLQDAATAAGAQTRRYNDNDGARDVQHGRQPVGSPASAHRLSRGAFI